QLAGDDGRSRLARSRYWHRHSAVPLGWATPRLPLPAGSRRGILGPMSVPSIEAHGARIPLIGLGTWDLRGRSCARITEQALRLGYRHVDTAELYDNEREVGE